MATCIPALGQSQPLSRSGFQRPEVSYTEHYRYTENDVNRHAEKNRPHHGAVPSHPKFETFGERLAYWRVLRGYKRQGALAETIKIAQPSLSELESGKSKQPAADVLLKLCDALHLRPKYLLNGDGPPESQYFQELSGLEAQLVMIYRQLPTEALQDSLLIFANDMLNKSGSGKSSVADPYAHVAKAGGERSREKPEPPKPKKIVSLSKR
jgi:transcriptional regulator with XRE-family HTH domain